MAKDKIVRVDKDIWMKARIALPGLSDQAISKVLFNTSPIRIESKLAKVDLKNKMGRFLYGKKLWKKF